MRTTRLRRGMDRALTEYRNASLNLTQAGRDLAEASQSVLDLRESQSVIQHAAQTAQETAHAQIASVVSRCLEGVFGQPYEFRIVFEKKRGRTEARFAFVLGGEEVDPLRMGAGGEVDVASFALRLAAMLLHKPPLRRLLVLDEPMRCLSRSFRPAMAKLMEDLCDELGVQMVIVTHDKEFVMGNVVEVS